MLSIWKGRGRAASPFEVPWPPVPIVSDAAIATDIVSDGRFLPLLILDTRERPDIADLIAMQEHMPPGDVNSTWVVLEKPRDHLALALHFQRPAEISALLNFDLTEQGPVVDLVMRGRTLYLQAGKPGDRFITTPRASRMIVEVGAEYPDGKWDERWAKAIERKLRHHGYRKRDARSTAASYIKQHRQIFSNPHSIPPGIYAGFDSRRQEDPA